MGGKKLPEAVYRELLAETRDAIKTVKELIKSENEDVKSSPSTPSCS